MGIWEDMNNARMANYNKQSSSQQTYDDARNAGASTGRARYMANQSASNDQSTVGPEQAPTSESTFWQRTYNPAQSYVDNSIVGQALKNIYGEQELNQIINKKEEEQFDTAKKQEESKSKKKSGLPQSMANTIAGIPLYQMLVPKDQREKQVANIQSGETVPKIDDLADEESGPNGTNAASVPDLIYNIPRKDWYAMEQAQQYNHWLDTDEGKAFLDKYGDKYSKENNGYTYLRQDRDSEFFNDQDEALADLLGFGDIAGIEGFRDWYRPNMDQTYGIDWSKPTALQDFFNMFYGDEAGSLDEWLLNEGVYDASKIGVGGTAYDDAARWYYENGPEMVRNAFTEYSPLGENFDAYDFAQLAAMVRATQDNNIDWTNLEDLQGIYDLAGEKLKFGEVTDDSIYKERNNPKFKPKKYTLNPENLNADVEQGLGDSEYVDALLSIINSNSNETGKLYGVS